MIRSRFLIAVKDRGSLPNQIPMKSQSPLFLKVLFGSKGQTYRSTGLITAAVLTAFLFISSFTAGCTNLSPGNRDLAKNVHVELVDWHISGLMIFNTPVCWIRVCNYNSVPVKDVRVKYKTFGYNGQILSEGTYTMEGTVGPRSVKNFVEQTVGLVDLESDMLSIEMDAVEQE